MTSEHDESPTVPQIWRSVGSLAVVTMCILAVVCLVLQFAWQAALNTWPVVVLNTLNTMVLFLFGYGMARWLGDLSKNFPGAEASSQAFVDRVMGQPIGLLVGLAYASSMSLGVWMFDPFGIPSPFRELVAIVLFPGNVLFGVAFVVVVQYWRIVLSHMGQFDIRILDLSRPLLTRLLTINSRVVTVTAFIASSSVIAAMFATQEQNAPIFGYSICVFVLVVFTYAVPIVPLANRLKALKAVELSEVDRLIEAHSRRLLGQPRRPDGPQDDEDLPELDKLLEVRGRIHAVQTLPPGGQVSVSATAIVTFFSLLPALIDFALDNLLGL